LIQIQTDRIGRQQCGNADRYEIHLIHADLIDPSASGT
jgi:hypothetical protein